jgi:signal transduction histidine kinase
MTAKLTPAASRPNWRQFWLLMLFWTVLGLIDAGQFYVHVNYFRGRQIRWEEALVSGLADWYMWAALAPFVMALARRFPIEHANWPRRLLLHLLFGTAFMLLKVSLDLPMGYLIHGWDRIVQPLPADDRFAEDTLHIIVELLKLYITVKFYVYLMIYAIIVGVAHFLVYYRRYRDRELATSRLEARLAQTQLQVLRTQLHPHFLFNTLNAISALMHKDVSLADRMISRLGELLRATLDDPGSQEVSLRRELDFLSPYLEIEQARLGPRLSVRLDVDDELLDARLPYLILQPLVENAIRHGLAPRAATGRLAVRAWRDNGRLVLEVADNGPGVRFEHDFEEGIGLSNTRARLKALYADNQSLSLRPAPGGGLIVTVTLPYRESPADSRQVAHELADPPAVAISSPQ